jgi:hypothetical protein
LLARSELVEIDRVPVIGRIGSATSARSAAFIEGLEVLKKIERLLLADAVEKVGLGLRIRKIRVRA